MTSIRNFNELNDYINFLCKQPANLFSPSFFNLHLKQVEINSLSLAEKLGADRDVVQVSSIIHDISAITDFSKLKHHESEGVLLAREILKDYPLSKQQKEKVFHCIETHSQPIAIGADISEAVCVSNADAISQIIQPIYWMFYIFNVRKFGFEDGYNWYKQRIESHLNVLIEPAKKIAESKYNQSLLYFK